MNIDDKKSFQSFTNHLIDDFQDYLPFTTLCKLHVIDCYLQDMTNNDITNSLANFAENDDFPYPVSAYTICTWVHSA